MTKEHVKGIKRGTASLYNKGNNSDSYGNPEPNLKQRSTTNQGNKLDKTRFCVAG
jgi:hypothetical protein